MQQRPECISAAICSHRTRWGRLDVGAHTLALLAALLVTAGTATAQETLPPAMEAAGTDPGAPPMSMSQSGGVNFFSQDLGTILRLRYNTESYGQDGAGNFDLGTMQVVTMDDSAAFFDGQVTMNESDGVGFNVGLGYRWMSFPSYALDTGRMNGVSLWADGTHTDAGNFFPQIGVSYESLGEMWDVRANGYIPVGQREHVGPFRPTNELGFTGNSIASLTSAVVDRSFYAAELEIARRMGPERDAWAFAGPYFVGNDTDDSAGVRVGVRGYAYPDLLLQFAVSDDDVFKTNATFSVVWFVGRTRTNFQPACGTADRMREPVLRNDYVVLSHTARQGGTALTQPDGSALRIVHVDSNAAAGGDGTFERPFDMLTDVNGTGSQKGDIILAHSTSVFTGEASTVLKDNQKLFGEGNNLELKVATKEKGSITIPESSPGARALARPMIVAAIGDAIVLADNNEVANFDMDGQNITAQAIAAPATGAGNPNLHNLSIKNTTGDGIFFTPEDFIDTNDVNGNSNTTERLVRGSVTIKDVTFNGVVGDGIHIDSSTAVDVTLPTVNLQETIAITNVTSTNGGSGPGRGIDIENTHSGAGHTTTLTGYTYDGGTTSAGGIRLNNFDGALTASTSTLTKGTAASKGVEIVGDSDGLMDFANTVTFNKLGGTAFDVNGGAGDQIGGGITVRGAITDAAVTSASVQGVSAGGTVTFSGNIISDTVTQTGDGIFVNSNATGSTIGFSGKLTIKSTANGFVAQDGGTLFASATTNSIEVTDDQALVVKNMKVANTGTNQGVSFGDVNRSGAATLSAIDLETNTGGPITVGNTTDTVAGQAGTITSGTTEAILIKDSADVSITALQIDNTAAATGATIDKTTNNAMVVDLNDLQIDGGTGGITASGNATTDNLIMTVNDTTINNPTANAVTITNVSDVVLQSLHVVNAGANGVVVAQDNTAAVAMDVTINQLMMDSAGGDGVQVSADSTNDFALKFTDGTVTGNVAMSDTGAGHFGLLVDSTDVDNSGGTVDAFSLAFDGSAANADVTIQNNNNFTAANNHALFINVNGAPTVRFAVKNSHFTNSSTDPAAEFSTNDTSINEVTIQDNRFENGGGADFLMTSNNSSAIRLNLGGSAAAEKNHANGSGTYVLTQNGSSTFALTQRDDTFNGLRNTPPIPASVVHTGTFGELGATTPTQPTVPP